MDDARAIELYGWSRELRKRLDGNSKFARFVDIPRPLPLSDPREAYLTHARQDLQDLANFVNEFTLNVNILSAWAAILPSLDEDELLSVTMEFINPPAYFCLGVPYALKGRLCSSVARVSHLANEFTVSDWQLISDLGPSSCKKAKQHAVTWGSWSPLAGALGRLDNKPYRKASDSFRNEFNHGSPRMIVTGEKPFVDRRGGLTVVGARPALDLGEIVSALKPQQRAAVSAHEAYVALVFEQVDVVMAHDG